MGASGWGAGLGRGTGGWGPGAPGSRADAFPGRGSCQTGAQSAKRERFVYGRPKSARRTRELLSSPSGSAAALPLEVFGRNLRVGVSDSPSSTGPESRLLSLSSRVGQNIRWSLGNRLYHC